MRILLAYYSRTGNTAAVSTRLATTWTQAGHHVEELPLTPLHAPRPVLLDWHPLTALTGRPVPIRPVPSAWQDYDLLCFGCGVRWFRPAEPLQTYLLQGPPIEHQPVAVFLTCGGMATRALRQLEALVRGKGGTVSATLVVKPQSAWDGLLGRELGHIERFDLHPVPAFAQQVLRLLEERSRLDRN